MDEPRLQAFRVRGRKRTTDAALRPDHARDLDLAPELIPVVGDVVDKLVRGDGDEVDIHDLGDRPHPAHRRAAGRADHRRFGDRRVDHPPRPELRQQATGSRVSPAVDADILADDKDRLVPPHLFRLRLAERLAVRHDPDAELLLDFLGLRLLELRENIPRVAPRRGPKPLPHLILGRADLRPHRPLGLDQRPLLRPVRIDVDIVLQLGHVRQRALLREADRLLDGRLRPVMDRLHLRCGQDARLDQAPREQLDRVALPPFPLLVPGAVGARIVDRMPVVAVGLRLDQRRPFAGPRSLHRTLHDLAHREYVLPVHYLARYPVGRRPLRHVRDLRGEGGALHPGLVERDRHPIAVVLTDVDDRQAAEEGGAHVQRLVEGAGIRGAFAEEAKDDAVRPLQVLRQRAAGRDRDVPRHNAGRAQVSPLDVGDVHRAAPPPAVAGRRAEQLGHHCVPVRLPLLLIAGHQVTHGAAVPVPAVGAGNQVARRDRRDRADRDPLLARGEVRGAADRQGAQQSVDRVLEVADLTHPPQHLGQLFFGIAARAQRIGDLLGQRGAGRGSLDHIGCIPHGSRKPA